jgi:hypothetical protein
MGYKIDSTWKQSRKNDIEELNSIIDDEYCNELEIGHKLNLMKKIKDAFHKALESFNFDIVLKFMNDNNWEWINYDGDVGYAIPTKEIIIENLKTDLKHGMYRIIELNEKSYQVFSGGILFEINIIGNNAYVSIYFDIAHFVKD